MIAAVLDTNVLVSAACFPQSLPADLLRLWLMRRFELVASEQIFAEFRDVMHRPKISRRFGIADDEIEAFVGVLEDLATIVPVLSELNAVPNDAKDNHIVACAIDGKAELIVSGDKHLILLGQYDGVKIVNPAQFFSLLQPSDR